MFSNSRFKVENEQVMFIKCFTILKTCFLFQKISRRLNMAKLFYQNQDYVNANKYVN